MKNICFMLLVVFVLHAALPAAAAQKAGTKDDSDLPKRTAYVEKGLTGWENHIWSATRWGVLGILVQTLFYLAVSYAIKLTNTELYRSFMLGMLFGMILFFLTIYSYSNESMPSQAKFNVLITGLACLIAVGPIFKTTTSEFIMFTITGGIEAVIGFCVFMHFTG